jgi:pimeloyl-ACP methyl ester carboxylesterase
MSAVILQNEIVHFEVLGRGRPVLFLHGWVGSWRYWIPAMQAASISYRAYALDFWGFGDTAKQSDRYLLLDQVNLIEAFMEHMGIAKVAIIGHGLGAVIGVMFAARFPAYVDRLMAVSLPVGNASLSPRLLSDSPEELAEWLLGRSPDTEAVRYEAPKTDAQAISITINSLDPDQILMTATQLATPVLIVHGLNDLAFPITNLDQHLVELPEQDHLIYFEQSGHFPMLDEPSKFNRLMSDFLLLKSGESPTQLQLKEEWKRRVR